MRLLLLCIPALLLSACSFLFSESESGDAGALADAPPNPGACELEELLLTEPGVYRVNTNVGELLSPSGTVCEDIDAIEAEVPYLRIKVTGRLEIGPNSRLVVFGIRPLEIDVGGDIEIHGEMDVSSRVAGPVRGAGADLARCADQVDANEEVNSDAVSGGGGGGGSFVNNGGAGGAGSVQATEGAPTGTEVSGWENSFRAGCRGGDGATRVIDNNDSAARGGHGGGAIRLISSGEILITGLVHASGAGGQGGLGPGIHGGGGGGGSGGMVWLRAAKLTIAEGGVSAKGGAGGEGGNACGPGAPGQDAAGLLQEQAAGGLTDEGCDAGGDGGGGSFGNFSGADAGADGDVGLADGGGGGGGGGPGIIFLEVLPGAIAAAADAFSPPPRTPAGDVIFSD